MAGTLGTHDCNGVQREHLFIHHDFSRQYYCHCSLCGKPIPLERTATNDEEHQ